VPVLPGCEIRLASMAMHGSMPELAGVGSGKIKSRREWFFRRRARSVESTWARGHGRGRSKLERTESSAPESRYVSNSPPNV
jgi:hypothetical protein